MVAQQSDTSLIAEYKGKPITADPFILSNTQQLELVYGTEEIYIPPLEEGNESLLKPNGSFAALEAALEIRNWQDKWERFLPIHQRLILLLMSIAMQVLLAIPVSVRVVDMIMSKCGYEVLPREKRRNIKRYRSKKRREVDLERGEDHPLRSRVKSILRERSYPESTDSRRSIPVSICSSDAERIRSQNHRAMAGDWE